MRGYRRSDLEAKLLPARRLSDQANSEHSPLELIKRLLTREGTLANLLRQMLTAEDLQDLDAAIPSLVERCGKLRNKPSYSQVKSVLRQLKKEAGV